MGCLTKIKREMDGINGIGEGLVVRQLDGASGSG